MNRGLFVCIVELVAQHDIYLRDKIIGLGQVYMSVVTKMFDCNYDLKI